MTRELRLEGKEPAERIRVAIAAELDGLADPEGRSPLDFLISEIKSSGGAVSNWREAAVELLLTGKLAHARPGWMGVFERFVVLANLTTMQLGQALEQLMTSAELLRADDRASLYAILDECGTPPSLAILIQDVELKLQDPLRWLDLALARTPRVEDAQQLVLQASRANTFTVRNFAQRLNLMRSLGGKDLGTWLREFRQTVDLNDLNEFDSLIEESFGHLAVSQNLPDQDFDYVSVRSLTLLEPEIAALPLDAAMKHWRPGSVKKDAGASAILALLQRASSYNQSFTLQSSYLTAEKHKELKASLRSRAGDAKIRRLSTQLLNNLNQCLYEAATMNFKFLHSYFALTGRASPRICLKGNFRADDSDLVVSIFRDHEAGYTSNVNIEQNTGFAHIKNTGRYFLENNIPQAVLSRGYVNPRLNIDEIKSQFKRATAKNASALSRKWRDFWLDEKTTLEKDAFYQSTLIYPLTLWGARIDPNFSKAIGMQEVDRSIYGYLCFDHPETDFFDKKNDPRAARFFADILCHYVFIRMTYTDFSSTFAAVTRRLGRSGKKLRVHKMDSIRVSLGNILDDVPTMPAATPEPPKLIATDQSLLDFIEPKKGEATRRRVRAQH